MSERFGVELAKPSGGGAVAPPERLASLQVAPVDDPLEHEAERVAKRLTTSPAPVGLLQRAPQAEGLGERRPTSAPADTAPPVVHDVLASPGQPLERETRAFFEPRLGMDLGDVRVHDDDRAARSAEAVDARAYTVGRDVVFAANRHAPHTSEGRALLAHELVHVAQQRAARSGASGEAVLARAPAEPGELSLEQRVAALEQQHAGDAVHFKLIEKDNHWAGLFDAQFASASAGVARISTAIGTAQARFKDAQIEQSEFNALVLQLMLGAVTIAAAVLFEPLVTAGLTTMAADSERAAASIARWAPEETIAETAAARAASTKKALMSVDHPALAESALGEARAAEEAANLAAGTEKIVERVENPSVAALGTGENVVPMIADVGKPDQPPSAGPVPPSAVEAPPGVAEALQVSDPSEFFTRYHEKIESDKTRISEAFAARALQREQATSEEFLAFDLAAEEAKYSALYETLHPMVSAEDLVSDDEAATVIELAIWAAWINKKTVGPHLGGPHVPVMPTSINIGSYVADRLNKIGVSTLAGVTLSTTPLIGLHTPENFSELLLQWANTYRPSLLTGG